MSTAMTDGRRITAAEKRHTAVTMRREGATFTDIADALGCARSMAFKHVSKALRDLAEKTAAETAQHRALECNRLDALQVGVWEQAISGDLQAAGTVLRIMERRAKLLGLDVPAKRAATTPDGNESTPTAVILPAEQPDIQEWLAQYCEVATISAEGGDHARH